MGEQRTKSVIELGPRLVAKAKMAPNEACWCGSGRKWKKCHRDREAAPRSNYFEQIAQQDAVFQAGYCSHPEAPSACVGKPIRSHTIQKSGGLSAIAEQGHVMSARGNKNYLHKTGGRLTPQKTGINSASTFNGFCSPHDAALFLPIESGPTKLTPETAFLSLYRCIAYEVFAKRAELAAADFLRVGDAGQPLEFQQSFQNYVTAWRTGVGISLSEIAAFKADLDKRYRSNDFSGISAVSTTFADLLPIAVSCAFHAEFDVQGNPLQSLMHHDIQYVTLSTMVRDGRTVVTFAWQGNHNTPAGRLANSFAALKDDDKATALAQLCFIHTENWHARPSWWEGLPPSAKQIIEALMRRGMPSPDGARVGSEYRVESAATRLSIAAVGDEILAG